MQGEIGWMLLLNLPSYIFYVLKFWNYSSSVRAVTEKGSGRLRFTIGCSLSAMTGSFFVVIFVQSSFKSVSNLLTSSLRENSSFSSVGFSSARFCPVDVEAFRTLTIFCIKWVESCLDKTSINLNLKYILMSIFYKYIRLKLKLT